MSLFDIILIIIIAGFGLFGLFFGLIHTVGSLAGTVLGIYLAYRLYAPVSDWLINHTTWDDNIARVVIFVVVFIIINRLVGLIFLGIAKLLSVVTRLPFINSTNRLLGMAFGLLEGAVVLGAIFYFIVRFPVGDKFMDALAVSQVAPPLVNLAGVFIPLIPEAIQKIDSVIESFK